MKLKPKTKERSSVIQLLKNELENKDFSHLITKARFQIKYVSDEKKICSSVISNIFPTQRNSLPVGNQKLPFKLLYFNNLCLKYKETMVKN